MASLTVPSPRFSALLNSPRFAPIPLQKQLSSPLKFQHSRNQSCNFKVHTHLNEFAVVKSLNSAPVSERKVEVSSSRIQDKQGVPDALSIETFFTQVADLIEYSRDIIEFELKQQGCEIIIRKKEASPQPQIAAPIAMSQDSQPSTPQAIPSQQAPAQVTAGPTSSSVPLALVVAPETASPAKSSSSHPLKCPMAGTFYRSPAPGAPPFVKVGDKVEKGQVVCIIEAMKLMNDIEVDQSGTVVEILVEDGKPVSVDTPFLIIQP